MGIRQKIGATSKPAKFMQLLLAAVGVAALLTSGSAAMADEQMVRVDLIAVPPGQLPLPVCVPGTPGVAALGTFDISFVDPKIDLYVLADRTNGAVDFFDASDDTFIGRVGGFAGVKCNAAGTAANNAISGPDGVVIVDHREVWAGDGDSTLKVIDIKKFEITDVITVPDPTNPNVKMRVDEMAWDSRDHILAAANNANVPPFVTLVDTTNHKILGQIVFDGSKGTPNATNTGIEQPQWSPKTGLFYVSVPQIDPNDATLGGVSVIDPGSMSVIATYPVTNCSPAGLALGPRHEAVIGCGGTFGTGANAVAQTIIINLDNGDILANITQAGGNDEVWFDPGTQHYYLSARGTLTNGKVTPILGTVDARTRVFDGGATTSTTAHSVAADTVSHHVFVPIGYVPTNAPAGTDPTNPCPTNGCIAVFLPSSIDDDDLGARLAKR
jgi:hypothetical protein